ncbi:MAG: twin-arginine translocation signal domain-containing protein, partial [Raoultibacter sp.]
MEQDFINKKDEGITKPISRRDMIKGAALAAASVGMAGIVTGCQPQSPTSSGTSSPSSGNSSSSSSSSAGAASGAASASSAAKSSGEGSVRVDGPGYNAGWGDTVIEDYSGQSFEDVIDGWFEYDWSYEREFAPGPAEGEKKHVTVVVSSPTVGGNGDTLAQTVVEEIGESAEVEVVYLRNLAISPLQQFGSEPPVTSIGTQVDGMDNVIAALNRASVVIAIAP